MPLHIKKDEDYPFVDEHDLLMSKLAPFRDMPADEVQRRTWEIGFQQSFSMVHIRNGSVIVTQPRRATHTVRGPSRSNIVLNGADSVSPSCLSPAKQDVEEKIRGRANGMAYSLRPIAHLLPDMTCQWLSGPLSKAWPAHSG